MTRVLVVEDSRTQAQELRLILESEGFEVETTSDGQKGLGRLREDSFDLVLSDILMPGLSGYELCRRIKTNPDRKDVPVILLTTLNDPMDIIQGLECGADNYLTKPYEADYLLGRIKNILFNKSIRAERKPGNGVELSLMGKDINITSDKEQILDLLISTFEELVRAKEKEHERKLAEEALQKSHRFLQSALDALSAQIAVLDESGSILAVNAVWQLFADKHPLSGTACGVGTNYLAVCEAVSGERSAQSWAVAKGIREVMANERNAFSLAYTGRGSKENRWFIVRLTRFEISGRVRVVVSHEDMTELKRAEEQIREQAALLDKATDAILVRDPQNCIIYWNRSAERLYGWTATEAVGKNPDELLQKGPAPELEQAQKSVLSKGEWTGQLRQVSKEGREILVESRWTLVRADEGRPGSKLVVNTDITEKKKLEAHFLRSQRMESIGTLAGGIAHDLNNVLTPIVMAIDLLKLSMPDSERHSILAELGMSAARGAEMVQQILLFARGVEGQRAPLQLQMVIHEIEKMVKRTLPKTIEIKTSIAKDLWLVSGDSTHLYQMLMNLCVNARDAMPQGGRLTIIATNTVLDANFARMHPDARPGPHVLIQVADTGTGIPADVLTKIFDPFFTTKEQGKGTGLGLSTALGIVKGHGGFLDLSSEVGRGSEFRIYLPTVEPEQTKDAEEAREPPAGNGELILVVDDEASIRQIAKETLEACGYKAMTASDGTEAVALYAQHHGAIKVALIDMMMPVMDGPATIRALQKLNPRVRVIGASGRRALDKAVETTVTGVQAFLQKPYTADKLLRTLHEVLQSK